MGRPRLWRLPEGRVIAMHDGRGAYTAERASALSGVPWSTVHQWARTETLVPSVSPTRVKLWSYTDLLGLRTIYWLRHPKPAPDGSEIPATPMNKVRAALRCLEELDLELWEHDEPTVRVERQTGEIWIGKPGEALPSSGPDRLEVLDLVKPFETEEQLVGPDLVRPRPRLRMIPGKLAGAPHIERTRLETEALGSLGKRGLGAEDIYALYPRFEHGGIDDALSLESQLTANLSRHNLVAAAA